MRFIPTYIVCVKQEENPMKKMIKWMLIVWVALMPLVAEETVELAELNKPEGLYVTRDMIYVLEGITVHMYQLDSCKYLGKFGKEGEGPGEIKKNPFGGPIIIVPHQGKLYITSMGKLSVFSPTGEFIREHKINAFDSFYPFADRFVCMGSHQGADGKTVLAIFLADQNLNRGKLLYASDFEVGQNFKLDFPIAPFYPSMSERQLFITAGKDGFAIDVFDIQGDRQYRIAKKEPSLPVPASYQTETEKAFKRNPNYAAAWEFFKTRISYKKTYPPIFTYFVDDERIYVLTNKLAGQDRECIVMDLKGREIKRMTLPLPEQYGMEYNILYTADRSVFYWLSENDDSEKWELFRRSLK